MTRTWDGLQERRFPLQPVVGVSLLVSGVALLWAIEGVPDLLGIAALVLGAVVLIGEFA